MLIQIGKTEKKKESEKSLRVNEAWITEELS